MSGPIGARNGHVNFHKQFSPGLTLGGGNEAFLGISIT